MNARERVIAVMNREIPDKIPKDLSWGLCPAKYEEFKRRTGCEDFWEYFQLDIRHLDFTPTKHPNDYSKYFEGRGHEHGFTIDEWGIGMGKSTDESLHFEHVVSPLKTHMTVEDAKAYPFPDFLAPYRHEHFKQTVDDYHKRGLAVGGLVIQTLFERLWHIRGIEETMMDMALEDETDAIEVILDRLTDLRIEQVKLLAKAGVDVLMFGDDIGMQTGMLISVKMFDKFFKPRYKKIIQAANEVVPGIPIFYHSCGNAMAAIPSLIEMGVTVLNPVQPECMNLEKVKELYGDKLAFWGGVSAQTNLSFGTAQDVKNEVKARIEVLGKNGGYLIGPNHVVEPEVPWENIMAYFEAVEEYGKY